MFSAPSVYARQSGIIINLVCLQVFSASSVSARQSGDLSGEDQKSPEEGRGRRATGKCEGECEGIIRVSDRNYSHSGFIHVFPPIYDYQIQVTGCIVLYHY